MTQLDQFIEELKLDLDLDHKSSKKNTTDYLKSKTKREGDMDLIIKLAVVSRKFPRYYLSDYQLKKNDTMYDMPMIG
jgi:hypothetical protein